MMLRLRLPDLRRVHQGPGGQVAVNGMGQLAGEGLDLLRYSVFDLRG